MKQLTTVELVVLLQNENKGVKSSTGGTKSFRSIMDFITFNSSYQDNENIEIVKRSKKEIAKLLESEFSKDVIDDVKNIYA